MFILEESPKEFHANYKEQVISIESKDPIPIIYGTLLVGNDLLFYGHCSKFDITVFSTEVDTARVLINMTLVKLWVDFFKSNITSGTTLYMSKKEKMLFETFTWTST